MHEDAGQHPHCTHHDRDGTEVEIAQDAQHHGIGLICGQLTHETEGSVGASTRSIGLSRPLTSGTAASHPRHGVGGGGDCRSCGDAR
jgi:hypothetical protein